MRFNYNTTTRHPSSCSPPGFCGFVISEWEDANGQLVWAMDFTKEEGKLIQLAGVSFPNIRKVKCPMPESSEIASDHTHLGSLESTFYRSTVCQIQYLARIVRYDVAHAISRLGQY